jgi:hypothetical protein
MFVTGKLLQPSLLSVGKSGSLPLSGAPERCLTCIGSGLAHKFSTMQEGPVRNKHSTLLQAFVRKKFDNICERS